MELKIVATVLVFVSLLFGTGVEAKAPESMDESTYAYCENWIENVILVEGVTD